jgi:hypothetical protein
MMFELNLSQSRYSGSIPMQVKDLTTDRLKTLIRETVVETLGDLLADPEEGLTVKEEFKQKLLEIQHRRRSSTRSISAAEAMKRLGLGI